MVVEGGMGTVTQTLAAAAMAAGATIHTSSPVAAIKTSGGAASGIMLADGTEVKANAVLVNADPFKLRALAGSNSFSNEFNSWLDGMKKDGTTLKARSVA